MIEEIILIARVLWGIWFFRNKKVWENKTVNDMVAMEWSAKYFADWRMAKESRIASSSSRRPNILADVCIWKAPAVGHLKLNTDAAIKLGESTFTVGLILRDHIGDFVGGKVRSLPMVSSVFEAEITAIKEGLQWLSTLPYQHVTIEYRV
ncbi:uncharacterized protein LOC135151929 [Daucus carota subsp. sativus]|uniref:uncharacterized protein LOC135151929 n=1 Tax=Daucus carota subsp. sativus TaxID=79200 RepID=UPI0030836760